MDYSASVQYLYALGNEYKTLKLGLERISKLLESLDNPHLATPCVHVAGTNGKGSTCAMIETALRAGGAKTGLYTSPHLQEPTERIQIGGLPVTREQFVAAFERVRDTAAQVLGQQGTYFETITAMGFLLFREQAVEMAVIETGLGGRLDATNVVTPRLSVITPIDYDHETWLGNTIEEITREKAGILKPGVPAVFARQRPEAERVLQARARELDVHATSSSEWSAERLEVCVTGSRFHAVCNRAIEIECPLAGEHQVINALTAIAALDLLGVPDSAIQKGIARTQWPGRLQRVRQKPEIWIDGAHNPAGARGLARHLERFFSDREVTLIFGSMRDKAVPEMASILFPLARRVILTAPAQARALDPHRIADLGAHECFQIAGTLREALDLASDADAVVITGSLYLAGEARALLVE